MMMFPLIRQESLSAVTSWQAEFCHLARYMNHDHENLCKRILIGKFFEKNRSNILLLSCEMMISNVK